MGDIVDLAKRRTKRKAANDCRDVVADMVQNLEGLRSAGQRNGPLDLEGHIVAMMLAEAPAELIATYLDWYNQRRVSDCRRVTPEYIESVRSICTAAARPSDGAA